MEFKIKPLQALKSAHVVKLDNEVVINWWEHDTDDNSEPMPYLELNTSCSNYYLPLDELSVNEQGQAQVLVHRSHIANPPERQVLTLTMTRPFTATDIKE